MPWNLLFLSHQTFLSVYKYLQFIDFNVTFVKTPDWNLNYVPRITLCSPLLPSQVHQAISCWHFDRFRCIDGLFEFNFNSWVSTTICRACESTFWPHQQDSFTDTHSDCCFIVVFQVYQILKSAEKRLYLNQLQRNAKQQHVDKICLIENVDSYKLPKSGVMNERPSVLRPEYVTKLFLFQAFPFIGTIETFCRFLRFFLMMCNDGMLTRWIHITMKWSLRVWAMLSDWF